MADNKNKRRPRGKAAKNKTPSEVYSKRSVKPAPKKQMSSGARFMKHFEG